MYLLKISNDCATLEIILKKIILNNITSYYLKYGNATNEQTTEQTYNNIDDAYYEIKCVINKYYYDLNNRLELCKHLKYNENEIKKHDTINFNLYNTNKFKYTLFTNTDSEVKPYLLQTWLGNIISNEFKTLVKKDKYDLLICSFDKCNNKDIIITHNLYNIVAYIQKNAICFR